MIPKVSVENAIYMHTCHLRVSSKDTLNIPLFSLILTRYSQQGGLDFVLFHFASNKGFNNGLDIFGTLHGHI